MLILNLSTAAYMIVREDMKIAVRGNVFINLNIRYGQNFEKSKCKSNKVRKLQ